MKNQHDVSLQIRWAGVAILGLFIALAAAAYLSGRQVKRDSELIASDAVPGTISAHNMRMAMSRGIGWTLVAASVRTAQSRDASLRTVHAADLAFTNAVKEYEATIKINPPKDRELLARVTSRFADYHRQRMAYEALILAGDRDGSAAFLESNLEPAYISTFQSSEDLVRYNHTNSIIYASHIHKSVQHLYWTVAVVMVLALISAGVLVVNVSFRRREITRLLESEEKFSKAFQANPVGIAITEMETGKYLEVNESFCRLMGYSPQELTGRTSEELGIWSATTERNRGLQSLLGGDTVRDLELQTRTRDGGRKTILVNADLLDLGGKRCIVALVQDVTERKQAEAALRASEQKHRDIFEQSPLGIYQTSLEGRLISANSALATIYHCDTPEQMLREDEAIGARRFIRPEQREEIVRAACESPVSVQREIKYRRPDGTFFTANLYMRAVRANNGTIQYLEGFVEDITERKRAMEQLEMLKVSIDRHFDAAYWMDTGNQLVYVNDTACKALGYAREELLGKPPTMFAPDATAQTLGEVWKRLRETGFYTRESMHHGKDRGPFPVEIVSTFVRFEGKEFNCSFARDITERKRTADALRIQTERLDLATRSAGIGIWDWDIQKDLLIWDDRMYSLYGIKRRDFSGAYRDWLKELHPEDRDHTNDLMNRVLRGEGEWGAEFRVLWPDGSTRTLRANGNVLRNDAGQPLRMIGINYDITERKAAEEALRQRVEEVRQRNAELERFNDAAEGRELRMIELKKEINQLLHQAGQPARYRVNFT